MDTLNRCLHIMPSPKVFTQMLQLARNAHLEEEMLVALEAERTGRDLAASKARVKLARRAAYSFGDAALARLLGDWLVQYSA